MSDADYGRLADAARAMRLRGMVLKLIDAAGEAGVGLICAAIRQTDLYAGEASIEKAVDYLRGLGYVETHTVKGRGGVSAELARITPKGVDLLEGTEQAGGVDLS